MKLYLIFLPFVVLCACKSSRNEESRQNKMLLGEWKVSHEEGSTDEIVLRPSQFNFPLSRMRDEFIFHSDQTVTYNTLGPADHPVTKKGKWEWMDDGILKLYIDENNTFYWKVEQLNDEILQVTKQ